MAMLNKLIAVDIFSSRLCVLILNSSLASSITKALETPSFRKSAEADVRPHDSPLGTAMSDQNFGPEITSRYLSPLHSPSESRCERSTGPRLRSSTLRRPNPFRRRRRCSPCRRNNAGQLRLVPYSAVRNSLCRDGPRAALACIFHKPSGQQNLICLLGFMITIKLAIELAKSIIRSGNGAERLSRRSRNCWSPNFDPFRAGSATWAAVATHWKW